MTSAGARVLQDGDFRLPVRPISGPWEIEPALMATYATLLECQGFM